MSQPLSLAIRHTRSCASFVLLFAFAGLARAAGPYDTSSDGADPRLMLKGRDPVAYFTASRPMPGDPARKTDFDGVTYRFVNEENRFAFMKNPLKYVPMFGGYCANSMVYAIPREGDPESWKIIDGRLYIFAGIAARRHFVMDEEANVRLAQRYWKDEVEGGFAIIQRARRLVVRVPHYKSDKELETEWQATNNPRP
jgi:YHS domain-containing protein